MGSGWTSAGLARPMKVFGVTSIGLRFMSESSSASKLESESDALDAVANESAVDGVFNFSMNWSLMDFHNCFLCSKNADMPSLDLCVSLMVGFTVTALVPLLGPSIGPVDEPSSLPFAVPSTIACIPLLEPGVKPGVVPLREPSDSPSLVAFLGTFAEPINCRFLDPSI